MKIDQAIAHKHGKTTKLGLHWRGGWINFCSLQFLTDGSLVFSSKFHNAGPNIFMGLGRKIPAAFVEGNYDSIHPLKSGFHITLHPKAQVMHFRENFPGKILDERKIEWFPVNQPFNLLYLYSLPLDLCPLDTKKKPHFSTPFPYGYTNSVQLSVDIFPRNTKEHHPLEESIWIFWGYSPEYLVRLSFNKLSQRTPALLLWPKDSVLSL